MTSDGESDSWFFNPNSPGTQETLRARFEELKQTHQNLQISSVQ